MYTEEGIIRKMWVFGFGSLMWDDWQKNYGCIRTITAELIGWKRIFNKGSVQNWGSNGHPGPTLNIISAENSSCWGKAFEFPEEKKTEVLNYLKKREGRNFELKELAARIPDEEEVNAIVPVYTGRNIISDKTYAEIAEMANRAKGTSGSCSDYILGIKKQLDGLAIVDEEVDRVAAALSKTVAFTSED